MVIHPSMTFLKNRIDSELTTYVFVLGCITLSFLLDKDFITGILVYSTEITDYCILKFWSVVLELFLPNHLYLQALLPFPISYY